MDKAAMKDSFERVMHEADRASLWDSDDSPFFEDWELVFDPYSMLEMELFIEHNRFITPSGHKKFPRRLPRG